MAFVHGLKDHVLGIVERLLTLHVIEEHDALGLLEELGNDDVVLIVASCVPYFHLYGPILICCKTLRGQFRRRGILALNIVKAKCNQLFRLAILAFARKLADQTYLV